MSSRGSLKDAVFMDIAAAMAQLGTCHRRSVGCVLVDSNDRILSTGYNGVAAGQSHCANGSFCAGATFPSGEGLELCEAIHAEQNALLFCPRPLEIETCYVTASPCVHCIKMLLNTSCKRIVYVLDYPHDSRDIWEKAGRIWQKL